MAFPQVAAKGTMYTSAGTSTTSHAIAYPAGITAGDLLLCVGGIDGTTGTPALAGFTTLSIEPGSSERIFVAYKIATGSEAGTVTLTTASEQVTARIWRINAWHGTTPPEIGVAEGASSANSNPPSKTASWGSDDNLWIAVTAVNGGPGTVSVYSLPDNTETQSSGGSGSIGHAACSDELAQATLDPGTFTHGAQSWVAATIVVRPAAGSTPKAGTDSAALTDSGLVAADLSGTDSSTLTDAATLSSTLSDIDSSTLTDVASATVSIDVVDSVALTDTGEVDTGSAGGDGFLWEGGTDSLLWEGGDALLWEGDGGSSPDADLDETDSVTLTDSGSVVVDTGTTDSASLTDAALVSSSVGETETGTVSEAESVAAALAGTDTGTVTDAATVASTLSDSDAGTLTDVSVVSASFDTTDSFTCSEVVTVEVFLAIVTDSVVLTDSTTLAVALDVNDQPVVIDSGDLVVSGSVSDSFTLTETQFVDEGPGDANRNVTDDVTLSETATVEVTLSVTEAVSGTDNTVHVATDVLATDALGLTDDGVVDTVTLVNKSDSDSATLSDAATLSASVEQSDTFSMSETISVHVELAFADSFTLSEQAIIEAELVLLDSLALTDSATLTEFGPIPDLEPPFTTANRTLVLSTTNRIVGSSTADRTKTSSSANRMSTSSTANRTTQTSTEPT